MILVRSSKTEGNNLVWALVVVVTVCELLETVGNRGIESESLNFVLPPSLSRPGVSGERVSMVELLPIHGDGGV